MAANDVSAIGAQLRTKYAPQLVNLVPEQAILQQHRDPDAPGATGKDEKAQNGAVAVPISWTDAQSLGKYWVVPTKVQSGQNFSYPGSTGALAQYNPATAMVLVEVQVQGFEVGTRQQITYKAASTAGGGVPKSFISAAKLTMEDMKDVAYNRIELSALWGQSGIGTISSQSLSGTTLSVIVTAASFSPALWVSNIGAQIEFFTATTVSTGLTQGTNYATVTAVNTSTRTVTMTTTGSGFNTVTVPAAGDDMYFGGLYSHSLVTGGTYNEMVGLYKQFSATTGTPFNVNIANYSLLQGNTFSAGSAPLTKAKVIQAAMKAVDKGNMSDMVLLVPTGAWADLAAEDMSLRMFDQSYSTRKSESGSEELVYTNLNGKIRVVCHPFMKAGFAFLFTPGQASWVGSSDVTFNTPGQEGQPLFLQVPDYNGYEMRLYADKALYHEAPSQAVVINLIVSSS